jgi:hypothetical protein
MCRSKYLQEEKMKEEEGRRKEYIKGISIHYSVCANISRECDS